MQTLNKKALTERICENFAGHKEVFMADVGNFLRKEYIDYKELGYKKLRDLMLALESFTLEDRFADPDSPPYTVVFLPEKREEKEQGQRTAHDEAALSKARQGILQHFAGQQTVLMADVGNFLRACQVDYKAMGYGKLKLFMEAMEGFVLEDTYPVPGAAAATLVHLPKAANTPPKHKPDRGRPAQAPTEQKPATPPEDGHKGPRLFGFAYLAMPKVNALSTLSGARIVPMEYLVERFEHILPTQTENAAWFDTGLTFRSVGRPIYAYFERNLRPGALQPWFFVDFRDNPAERPRAEVHRQAEQAALNGHKGPKLFDFAYLAMPKINTLGALCGTQVNPMEYLTRRFDEVLPTETAEAAWFDTGMVFAETGKPIYAFFEKNLRPGASQPWFFVDFRENPAEGGEMQRVRRVQPGKALEAFAYMGVWSETLETLADMALPENWDFLTDSGVPSKDKQLLHSYLCYTFYRLQRQGKVVMTKEEDFAAFNTGLVTPSYDDIYACFDRNQGGSSPWQLAGFCRAGERGLGKKLTEKFNPLPQAATYFENLKDVLYETTLTPIVDYQHIIIDNLKRLPLAFIRTQCYDSREAMALADRIERTDNPYAKRQLMGELAACIEENQTLFNRIRNRIKDAIELAVKRVNWNYKTAIPMFYPRGNTMSLLLPLCLNEDNRTDVALVVQRMESGNYQGQTILTLPQAYLDARLVCRPDSDWLRVDTVGRPEELDD